MPNLLEFLRISKPMAKAPFVFDASWEAEILPRQLFMKMLCLERKRSERSGRRFVLMLLEPGSILDGNDQTETFGSILSALRNSIRETDITGWYGNGITIGVIFTEIADASIVTLLSSRVTAALGNTLTVQQVDHVKLSFLVFPDDCAGQGPDRDVFSALYPDVLQEMETKKAVMLAKRCMDVVGSLVALALLLPFLLVIAAAVKLTSRGPLLFKQKRLGQYGKSFTFLKFRTMYVGADQAIHEAYVKEFISASKGDRKSGKSDEIYKIKADPRVTAVGRFLRRTSLDELPQFFNSLTGQMALVGPRPPLPYEFSSYEIWHKRRLLAVKPGITGLWQVKGRSRVKFDAMVRMDLEYARDWSLWLDMKILLQTPRAVVSGAGAY